MKICIFSTTYFPKAGGAERFIHGLATNLVSKGHDVFVLVPYEKSLGLHDLVEYKILRIRFLAPFKNTSLFLEVVLFLNLLFYFFRYRFSVIQAVILYPNGFVASLFTKIFGIPSVLRPTGEDIQIYKDLDYGLRLDPFIDRRVREALRNCSSVIAISPSIDRDLLSVLGYSNRKKIFPISNGIDLAKFREKVKFNIKKDLNLKDEDKVIISVGRNHPKKDYETLIKAVKLCPSNYHLAIIGGGEDSLRSFVTKDCSSRIHLLGQLPKNYAGGKKSFSFPPEIVVDYLKTSDLYASSSLIEGSPNVILEAMAAGLPIVAVDAPGTCDYVKNSENGILVSSKNPGKLASAIKKVLSSSKVLSKYAQRSKEMSKLYGFNLVANEYVKVYNSVIK